MEDDLNGRQIEWKTTFMEDNLKGRHPCLANYVLNFVQISRSLIIHVSRDQISMFGYQEYRMKEQVYKR